MKHTLTLAFAAALLAASAGNAHADCKPVIDAYLKADATKRYAVFDVDSMAQAPKGEPFLIVVDGAEYQPNMVRKGPLNIVMDGYTRRAFTTNGEARALKEREARGEKRCEALGDRKVGTEAVVGYRVRAAGKQPDVTANDVWISRASGLPLWHGLGSDDGGYRWVYGAAVVAPAADKVRK